MKKKGVSPIIATVLLISIVLVLAIIIAVWARGFVGEKIIKFNRAIELACDDIDFDVELDSPNNKIYLTNKGNVPIYQLQIRKKGKSSVKAIAVIEDGTVLKGESKMIPFDFGKNGLSSGDEIEIIPMILGEYNEYKKPYVCDEDIVIKDLTI